VGRAHLRQSRPAAAASARPLLPDRVRPLAGGLLACCAVIVAALGALFAHQTRADWFDHAVDAPIIAWFNGHQGFASWLAAPGSLIPAGVLTAAIVIGCVLAGRLNGAFLALAAVPVSEAISEGLLKPLVHRTYLGGVAYPSGHTTAISALTATLIVLLLLSRRPVRARAMRRLSVLIPAAACVVGVGVAIGLIGLRWHYFTDIVAGAAVGIGTVCGLALLLDLAAVRRWFARERHERHRSARKLLSSGRGTGPAEVSGRAGPQLPELIRGRAPV
jgi:membrane-associated phospholipid phosphatase